MPTASGTSRPAGTGPRPRTVTWACATLGAGAALLLVWSLVALAALDEPQLRSELERAMQSRPIPADISVETLRDVIAWLLRVLAVLSVPTAVFAVYAARGDRAARVALTVLGIAGALLFVLAGVPGVVASLLIATCVTLLWARPARAWYAAVTTAPRTGGHPDRHNEETTHGGERSMSSSYPPPNDSGDTPSAPSYGQQGYGQQGYGQQGYGQPSPYPRDRPGNVLAAGIITIVMSVITGGAWLLIGVLFLAVPESELQKYFDTPDGRRALDDVNSQLGWTESDVLTGINIVGAVSLVVGLLMLLSIIWAVMAIRGSSAGRVLLVIASAVTVLIGLFITVTGFFFALIWVIAGAAVIAMLYVGDAGAWFAGKRAGAI